MYVSQEPGASRLTASNDLARGLAGRDVKGGVWWSVELHAQRGFTYEIDAPTLDRAQACAVAIYARRHKAAPDTTAATVTRLP